ncbi:unnamed protein product [Auanema sp. JU1783]|nr:unnamed protein product [Auanema sp. JU1783]
MGNTSSTVTAGIKDQVNNQSNAMYKLADVTGNGFLAELAREAIRSGNTDDLDHNIREKIGPLLYNNGEGEMLLINDIISFRHKERTGNSFPPLHSWETKFVCWDLHSRGSVGETLLHTCFLAGLPKHMKLLAERMLFIFPKIINDFYISDEYYGETVLHMAIETEDAEILRFILNCGADVNARCTGNFFTCDDQKSSRCDISDMEHVSISRNTTYSGHLYWGEYPLSFAACLSQMECFRMIIAKGADLNAMDSNGNTILHICTIHENWGMFKMALTLGADLHIQNRQNLTPCTLAAFLAKKQMFEKIVEAERMVYWTYGGLQSAAYPLEHLDSIEPSTGNINRNSALALVVYGEKSEHLQLLPNLLEQLVQRKWATYGRRMLFAQLFMFILYFLCTMACYILRPTPFERQNPENTLICISRFNFLSHVRLKIIFYHILNICTVVGASLYLFQMHSHIRNVGRNMYFLSLSGFPAKAIFLISCVLLISSFIMRLFCFDEMEDIVMSITILLTAVKFLFFARGFKSVGPFVLMLYKIIIRDLMRFFLIYLVIVVGFSQAFYIIFLGYKKKYTGNIRDRNIMGNIAESYVRMFIMSLTEFSVFFQQLEECEHTMIGKITFVIYMLLVTLLLINMLIAMMTNTYIEVSGNSLEWLRQWAAIIMMMEQSFDPTQRLKYQRDYSIIMEDGKHLALLIKTKLKDDEYAELMQHIATARLRFREERRRIARHSNVHRLNTDGANYFRPKKIFHNNKTAQIT